MKPKGKDAGFPIKLGMTGESKTLYLPWPLLTLRLRSGQAKEGKRKTLDPRLRMSGMTEREMQILRFAQNGNKCQKELGIMEENHCVTVGYRYLY